MVYQDTTSEISGNLPITVAVSSLAPVGARNDLRRLFLVRSGVRQNFENPNRGPHDPGLCLLLLVADNQQVRLKNGVVCLRRWITG